MIMRMQWSKPALTLHGGVEAVTADLINAPCDQGRKNSGRADACTFDGEPGGTGSLVG